MLYWFYRHLDVNLFQYITVRAGFAFIIALILTLWLMPKFIAWAKKKELSQPIYDLAPEGHKHKAKTPTMGGVVFIFATLIATMLTAKLNNYYIVGGLLTLSLFSYIGYKDDASKIFHNKNNAGLSPSGKLLFQIFFSFGISLFLFFYIEHSTEIFVPFYKNPLIDIHYGVLLFWPLVFISTSNAVNLTDGLDGLATVPSILALVSLGVLTYITGHAVLSEYLLMPKIIGVGEVVILAAALAGALIGFLWYNAHPAEIFMGDSGSLAIGAFLAYMAIIAKSEILLILIGFIFVLETVSVMLQVGSFKLTKKRVFLMAPIHHHFEMKKWAENKIIVRFWIIAMLSNLLALLTIKLR
jgi:phospho-N-acetylmuramoyl-pentapeptide-transferase